MDYKKIFLSLSDSNKDKSNSFEHELFKNTSFYFDIKTEDLPQAKASELIVRNEEVSIVEESPVDKTEKEQIVESLSEYVQKETEKLDTDVLNFQGGEVKDISPTKSINLGNSDSSILRTHKIIFITDYAYEEEKVLKTESDDLFNKMVKAMGLVDEDYLVLSLCHIDEKENLFEKQEIKQNLLDRIVENSPLVIVSMGMTATRYLLERKERLTKVRGQFFNRLINKGLENEINFKIIPIFHPDFLLINPSMKSTTWTDLKSVMKEIGTLN